MPTPEEERFPGEWVDVNTLTTVSQVSPYYDKLLVWCVNNTDSPAHPDALIKLEAFAQRIRDLAPKPTAVPVPQNSQQGEQGQQGDQVDCGDLQVKIRVERGRRDDLKRQNDQLISDKNVAWTNWQGLINELQEKTQRHSDLTTNIQALNNQLKEARSKKETADADVQLDPTDSAAKAVARYWEQKVAELEGDLQEAQHELNGINLRLPALPGLIDDAARHWSDLNSQLTKNDADLQAKIDEVEALETKWNAHCSGQI